MVFFLILEYIFIRGTIMENTSTKSTWHAFTGLMLDEVPSYANKFFYSLGFLSMTSFLILLLTGIIMAVFGPDWWLVSKVGVYIRSVHLWATQAFIFFIFLHLLIVFLTSGFKGPRKLTWVLGVVMLLVVFAEAEFGYILRGDYSSQWRSLQASDFYNGAGLGHIINNLNSVQIYGIHIAILPITLLLILSLHYFLIKVKGIAKPYKSGVEAHMVKANHNVLFLRGGVLTLLILILAFFFNSPYLQPYTIKGVAKEDPKLIATTLLTEFNHTSETATYENNIRPYTFDSRQVYIEVPYQKYMVTGRGPDYYAQFTSQDQVSQQKDLKDAQNYFDNNGALNTNDMNNPVISVVSALTIMAQSDLYEDSLKNQSVPRGTTYDTRFLADTGVLEAKAEELKITTPDYGMVKEETGNIPPGAWWLTPIGILNHTILANDDNGDRDGAAILGLLVFFLLAFPFIPFLNRLPEKLPFAKLIWR